MHLYLQDGAKHEGVGWYFREHGDYYAAGVQMKLQCSSRWLVACVRVHVADNTQVCITTAWIRHQRATGLACSSISPLEVQSGLHGTYGNFTITCIFVGYIGEWRRSCALIINQTWPQSEEEKMETCREKLI